MYILKNNYYNVKRMVNSRQKHHHAKQLMLFFETENFEKIWARGTAQVS